MFQNTQTRCRMLQIIHKFTIFFPQCFGWVNLLRGCSSFQQLYSTPWFMIWKYRSTQFFLGLSCDQATLIHLMFNFLITHGPQQKPFRYLILFYLGPLNTLSVWARDVQSFKIWILNCKFKLKYNFDQWWKNIFDQNYQQSRQKLGTFLENKKL